MGMRPRESNDTKAQANNAVPALPGEIDIQRHLLDIAARTEVSSAVNRRQALMQRLMARIHVLSDKEFETAYHSLDSMVDRFCMAKAESKPASKGTGTGNIVQEATKALGNTLDKALQDLTRIQGK
jgi:hypothetical protein